MAKHLQVRNLPDETHRRLRIRAAEQGVTLSELVRAELTDVAERPTVREVIERIESLEPVDIDEATPDALRAGRDER
ncbi:MAG: FitA-like ribbon-helix-helix domain-containing protein [Solirubrobacterales bacterium]